MCSNIPAATAYGVYISYKTLHRKIKSEQHEHQAYSTTDNQVIVATVNFRIDDFNLTLGSVDSLLAATLYPGNPDWNRKLWNIVSTERYILHTASDYPFDIFKLFLHKNPKHCVHLNTTRTVKLELQTVKG
jgi:hypothetical protein